MSPKLACLVHGIRRAGKYELLKARIKDLCTEMVMRIRAGTNRSWALRVWGKLASGLGLLQSCMSLWVILIRT